MEILKKTILQAVTTGITACTGTTGTCYVIIPDTGVTYNFNIILTQNSQDIGFFFFFFNSVSGTTINYDSVTGSTKYSRLDELKKYAINVPFNQQYISGGNSTTDGVDYGESVSGVTMTYYIGGIKYIDNVISGTTIFEYTPQGTGFTGNFINSSYIKNPDKEKIISNPKIIDDVFITRGELSAFNKNYRLEYIRNLVDLTTYAGGKYFNIINNS